jgi:hypothetical protein
LRAVVLRALVLRARDAAPFFAEALRLEAARLRVLAAFFAAALRVPAPPMSSRFSTASAAARRSDTMRRPSFSAFPRGSLSRSASVFATRLRNPEDRR